MHTLQYLKYIPCSIYDIRILRIYPSTSLFQQMLSSGEVTEDWWLKKDSTSTCNHLLPSCLSMHFKHRNFNSMQLQHIALQFTSELNRMKRENVSHVLRIGYRGNGLKLAGTILYARKRAAMQARMLLKKVEDAME